MTQEAQMPERKMAIALHYDPTGTENAPRVTAKGEGFVADEILRIARETHVPLHHNPALAGALTSVEIGTSIPPEMFRAVAEVLAWVYSMNGKA